MEEDYFVQFADYVMSGDVEMNILIITQGISPIVEALQRSPHNIVGIIEDAPRITPSKGKRNFNRLISKVKPRTKTLTSLCDVENIPYLYSTNENQDLLESWTRSKNPELIVVYSMSRLLKENIISVPKYGVINIHPSRLPSYRGPNPFFWMYYNMERKGGITVHYINKGEDTGEVIYQESYDIPIGSSGPDLQKKIVNTIGVTLLLKAINAIEAGDAPKVSQPEKSPTLRARNILPEEQNSIISWEKWDVERSWHLMRGYVKSINLIEPPKGIYTGQRWTVGGYSRCDTSKLKKGVVLKRSDGYYIAGSNGIIQLSTKFQLRNTIRYLINWII